MTERDWRQSTGLHPFRNGLALVLLVAAGLRFAALGHGIPFAIGVDEPDIVERAVNAMRSGDFNPRFHDYPGLYIHTQTAVAVARFMTGAMAGKWTSLDQANPAEFYLWGRAVTAILGIATVFVVFELGKRWSAQHALLAAGLMAVLPTHVRESHYVLTDVPVTFAVSLVMLFSIRAYERATLAAFALAGAAAGLAIATKYNGAVALVIPLVACWMRREAKPSRLACALTIVAAAAVACVLGSPYLVLDFPGFLNGIARLAGEYRDRPMNPEASWSLYLKHLRLTLGWPGLLLAGGGLVLAVVRLIKGPARARWALIAVFPVLYFWFISRQTIVFARYLLPILPAICLLISAAVISGVSVLRRYEVPKTVRNALIVALTAAAILPPAIKAVDFDRTIARTSTAALAYEWITKNLPPTSNIVIESRVLLLPPPFASRNVAQLRRKTYEQYRNDRVDYLIASSQAHGAYLAAPDQYKQEYEEYAAIFSRTREVIRFAPSDAHPGPELRVLKVEP